MNNWTRYSIYQQLGNIGSEVGRAFKWKAVDDKKAVSAAERALELLDWTLADGKNKKFLKEIARVREVFADSFFAENNYGETEKTWNSYFLPYALAANTKV